MHTLQEDAGSGASGSQASGSEGESGRSSSRSSSRGPAGSEVVVQSGEVGTVLLDTASTVQA